MLFYLINTRLLLALLHHVSSGYFDSMTCDGVNNDHVIYMTKQY